MKPLGTEPSSLKSKRLDIATKVLQSLIGITANAPIVIDAPDTIQCFVRLSYMYADELIKYESVSTKDIKEVKPVIAQQPNIIPGQLRKVGN